ncbi:hypothetical protein LEAN103870_16240 [Legionella anisa]|uniref:Type IV secretion protein Dot n=1 Tax=Legionella anisa TaxID=28082 RepID=A0AAX0WRZ9_9GAMM|nr:hypothetical protein [Legionella anisa]AWN75130.1 hypothetical protein DLD14_15505 [Legionella anisa]KTC68495.1 substrate of the Dot/Icm secretion system [Legionella anisa]MBN5934474.1 hypothetical protein [Legionella anisa]MCW8424658.1 hypothetical protein [Legionella anisa]MCW8446223.1 hypothetical protein [Legionella anisa]
MTFVLKDLSELRKLFDHAVSVYLKREKKGKIEDLSDRRKFELQFLSSILEKLEEQSKEHSVPTANLVFYGAMYTVLQDIRNNRKTGESFGLLYDDLNDIIGIGDDVKEEDKPDLYQIAKFYTALNAFLNQVFIENDSRKGFAKNHMLTAVPTESLSKLIHTSYQLENEAQKAIVASFTTDGQTAPELSKYKAFKRSPVSATVRFGGWDKLNADLDELIKDELADKNVSKIEKLSKERIAQLHSLNAIRNTLKTSAIEEDEKVAILAGAMHLVRQQIIIECASSYLKKKENSVIFKGLNKLLAIDVVSSQDVESLVTSATQFIQFMTVDPKKNGKKAIRNNHIFSAIADFDLKATFNLLIDMIFARRTTALDEVVEEFKKETKAKETKAPEKAKGGYLASALGYFRTKKEDDSEDEEDILEHKSNVTAKQ